jgi:hypothetical protein
MIPKKKLAHLFGLLNYVWEVSGSNIGLDVYYFHWNIPQFSSLPQATSAPYFKSGLDGILPHPFPFIIHYYPLIRPYIILVTDSIVKLTTYINEVCPCFFLSWKAKMGHGPHSSQLVNCVVLYIVCAQMCTVLLSPGVNPIAVKRIYHFNNNTAL